MKNKHIQIILLLFTCSFILLTVSACANEVGLPTHTAASTHDITNDVITDITNSETEQPSETTTEQLDAVNEILADLNHDGTDDTIIITYDNEQQSSATIRVINGTDNSELMSDTLIFEGNKIGAYYLQLGNGNERDRLVFWHYEYLEDGNLYFYYSAFSYEPDGKIIYTDRGGDSFNVSNKASIAKRHQAFLVMREEINENIQSSRSHYTGYLLLDNQGASILVSTADNMLTPTDLLFELEDFAIDSKAE